MKRNINNLLFRLKYHPIVIDKEYIPIEENVIFCGNHLTKIDSKLVNFATSRDNLWLEDNYDMCKDRLHKGYNVGVFPEGLINTYRNIQLRIMALENEIVKANNNPYLRSGERMISVTYLHDDIKKELEKLEKVKEELEKIGIKVINNDVLLPFQNEAIKLAYETNIKIVPFAIDYHNLYKNSKIKVRFGEPITVSSDTKKENELLRNTVKQLIYKNHKKNIDN